MKRKALGVPLFLVAVDLSLAKLPTGVTAAVVRNMAEQIGWGLVAGIGAGTVAGLLLRAADDRGWLEGQWRQILPAVAAPGRPDTQDRSARRPRQVASAIPCKSAGLVPRFMIRLGDDADSFGLIIWLGRNDSAWPELARWFERRAATLREFHPIRVATARVCGWQAETMQRSADGRDALTDQLAHHASETRRLACPDPAAHS
jgi:hypothetical protein